MVAVLGTLTIALTIAACPPQNTPQPFQPGGGGAGGYVPAGRDGGVDTTAPLGDVGEPCDTVDDCASGVCEGLGCGPGQGACAPSTRTCTADVVAYCDCDGRTFESSSSCPGRRYAATGACARVAAADGDACLTAGDCASGVCEGPGCDDGAPGVCVPAARACTKDLRPYCGCDGQTFRTSGSCPGRRYATTGQCPSSRL